MNLFRKADNSISAPVDGKCIDITQVSDNVFNSKMVGDGFAVIPSSNTICAPADGEIIMLAPTKHAFGLTTAKGTEILVHIGIDTVNLQGRGFEMLAKAGQKVKKGTPVIRYDEKVMKEAGYDMSIITVVTSGWEDTFHKDHIGEDVKAGSVIIAI
jgi:PTS system glucose-specific IIA component